MLREKIMPVVTDLFFRVNFNAVLFCDSALGLRLCRLMCGKALPFRIVTFNILEALPPGIAVA